MKSDILLRKLAKRFPKRYAKMNHDRVGLMTGKKPEEIHKVVLALDMEWEIFDFVKEQHPDVVITHHPLIFGPRARVLKGDESKRKLVEALDELGIPVYSFHTNYDTGKGGMNDNLAEALGLQDIYAPQKDIMMRIGTLPKEMPIMDFCKFAKQQFDVSYSLLIHSGVDTIKKVGIVGGGGSRAWPIAKEEDCDIYISGDAPHHVRRGVVDGHFNYLDMPHEIEKIFIKGMKKVLLEIDDSLEVVTIDHEKLPLVV